MVIVCYPFKLVIGCSFYRTSPHIGGKCWRDSPSPFFRWRYWRSVHRGCGAGFWRDELLRSSVVVFYTAGDEQLPISYSVSKGWCQKPIWSNLYFETYCWWKKTCRGRVPFHPHVFHGGFHLWQNFLGGVHLFFAFRVWGVLSLSHEL